MAISKQTPLEFKILHIALIVCKSLILVNSASVYSDTGEGDLCELKASPDFVAFMECRFLEPVHYMQVDFYRQPTLTDAPVTVVSCGDISCDLSSNFIGTLELRGAPTNYTLTLKVQSVREIHAGMCRCQAQSIKDSKTVHGVCSVRAPESDKDAFGKSFPPSAGSNTLYVLFVLLVVPIAVVVIVVCRAKSLGPWKPRNQPIDDTVEVPVGSGHLPCPEGESLVTLQMIKEKETPTAKQGQEDEAKKEGASREESRRILKEDDEDDDDENDNIEDDNSSNVAPARGNGGAAGRGEDADSQHVPEPGSHDVTESDVDSDVRLPTSATDEDAADISLHAVRRL